MLSSMLSLHTLEFALNSDYYVWFDPTPHLLGAPRAFRLRIRAAGRYASLYSVGD